MWGSVLRPLFIYYLNLGWGASRLGCSGEVVKCHDVFAVHGCDNMEPALATYFGRIFQKKVMLIVALEGKMTKINPPITVFRNRWTIRERRAWNPRRPRNLGGAMRLSPPHRSCFRPQTGSVEWEKYRQWFAICVHTRRNNAKWRKSCLPGTTHTRSESGEETPMNGVFRPYG
jgi:hypothetical protein